MSEVTNLLISFSPEEDDLRREAEIRSWLHDRERMGYGGELVATWRTHGCAGGGPLQVPLYACAYDNLPLDEFLAFLGALPWRRRDSLQVFVCGQHDDRWSEISPTS